PSGGCLLTEKEFSKKVKDLFLHSAPDKKSLKLLKIGRHFRINSKVKLIVGRNLQENKRLKRINSKEFIELSPINTTGPLGLAPVMISAKTLNTCARIVASYSDKPKEKVIKILVKCPGRIPSIIAVYKGIQKELFKNLII
ncbi:hypothetical protein DRJ22_05870, partial [Candidatus Woesearchaeota archaeon]